MNDLWRIHVLIEKPIAASITGVSGKCRSGLQCIPQVGHIERFNPAFQELSALKTEELLALEAQRMSPYSHRANDVSVVLD